MPLKLNSAGGGSVTLDVPSTASNFTQTAPAVNGNLITTGDTGTVTGTMIAASTITPAKLSQPLTQMTSVASTSGSAITFTGIPSWAKRVTILLDTVSTNGTSLVEVRVGTSSGLVTTGYVGSSFGSLSGATPLVVNNTDGVPISPDGSASYVRSGRVTITNISGNTWIIDGVVGDSGTARGFFVGYKIALAAALDRVAVVTVNGTDLFDLGSINVLYE